MKYWVALTIVLYLLCMSVVVIPLFLILTKELEVIDYFYYWLVPVLVVAQGVLLLVPVGIAKERPIRRRGGWRKGKGWLCYS